MTSSPLEKRTTMISTGSLPSRRLLELSSSRPFVHQVDVIFPFDRELQTAFSKLETDYYTSRAPLAEIYEALRAYGQEPGLANDAQVASTGTFLPDAWSCREGSITLSAGKDTFQALGLPGTKLSARMSGAPEQYLISISLNTPSTNVRSREFILDSFTRWDLSREGSGEGQWDFAFHVSHPDKGTGPLSPSRTQRHKVEPIIRKLQNVHIPTSTLPPRPNLRTTSTGRRGRRDLSLSHNEKATDDDGNDVLQDWNERASSLFEWVGMVNVGAQRLQANDRVDPYVAVYSAPAPFIVGDMLHIRWQGFLTPQFIQGVVGTATRMATSQSVALIGLTIHGSTEVPVLTPHRVPRLEGEDTASVILAPEGASDAMTNTSGSVTGSWVMVESIGKWDSRFGGWGESGT
ncbi:ribonuclease P 40kDa subunit-domain-containing protein, partial [Russula compacta]